MQAIIAYGGVFETVEQAGILFPSIIAYGFLALMAFCLLMMAVINLFDH